MAEHKFHNYMNHQDEEVAVEFIGGAWWIKPGFAGFNCAVNNLWGYTSKRAAESAIRSYQNTKA